MSCWPEANSPEAFQKKKIEGKTNQKLPFGAF